MKGFSRRTGLWIAAGMLIGGSSAVAQNSPSSLVPIKISTSVPALSTAVAFTMVARGFDKAHGLSAELVQMGGNSPLMIDAVVSGNVDFATPGIIPALQAIRSGANVRILGAIANNHLVVVMSDAAIKKSGVTPDAPIGDRMRALKGLTIGANPVGSNYNQLLQTYLKEYDIDPDKDVRLVGISDTSALISGIQQGRFDAIVSASGAVEQAVSLKAGQLWISAPRGDIPGSNNTMTAVVLTCPEIIENRKDIVEKFRAAMSDLLKALHDDRAATGEALKTQYFNKMDPAVWDMAWNNATAAYPPSLAFPKATFDFWIAKDPKGAESYKDISYSQITYGAAQSN